MGRLGLVAADAPPRRLAFLRLLAPVALLACATLAVLVVRAAFQDTHARPSATKVEAAVASTTAPPAQHPARKRVYVIRSGDTLGAVATRFDTTVERLLALNPGISPTALRIGAKIRVG